MKIDEAIARVEAYLAYGPDEVLDDYAREFGGKDELRVSDIRLAIEAAKLAGDMRMAAIGNGCSGDPVNAVVCKLCAACARYKALQKGGE